MTLLALAACRPGPPDAPEPRACAGLEHTTFSAGTDVVLDLPGCGTARITAFEPLGDGPFDVTVFSGGDRVMGYVEPRDDARLEGLRIRGTFDWDTGGEALAWAWPRPGEGGAPPGPAPVDGAWAGAVSRGGATVLVGALGGETAATEVHLDGDGFDLVQGGALGLELPGGRGVYFDPVALVSGADPAAVWSDWGALAAEQTAAEEVEPLPWGVEVPADASPEEVDAALAAWPGAAISVGAGWPAVAGAYEDDPRDVAALISRATASGARAGIAVEAFAVDPAAPLAAEHPDWLVADPLGAPLVVDGHLVLDASDGAAVKWLARTLREQLGGVGFLVVTGLDDAAVGGVRDSGPLGALALRAGLRSLRRELGDVSLVAADGPELTVVGVVDGLRLPAGEGDALRAGIAARLPLAPVVALEPPALLLEPGAPSSGAIAASVATGTLRLDSASDPSWAAPLSAVAPRLGSPAAVPSDPAWTALAGPELVSLVAPSGTGVTVGGPGGTELLTGEVSAPGDRELLPGAGEIWAP